jgi:hypothetical protein
VLSRWLRQLTAAARPKRAAGRPRGAAGLERVTAYPGDFHGVPQVRYSPHPDGLPDPGEIVWTWVPFEEDYTRGKDRPVLIIGRDGALLLGLMLTSKDHDRDVEMEARYGRHWLDIGAGPWDVQRRPSEVRLDRVLRLQPQAVRREGATLPRTAFDQVAAAIHGLGKV